MPSVATPSRIAAHSGRRGRLPERSRGSMAREAQAASAAARRRCSQRAASAAARRREREPEEAGIGEVHGSAVSRRAPAANGRRRKASAAQAKGWKALAVADVALDLHRRLLEQVDAVEDGARAPPGSVAVK